MGTAVLLLDFDGVMNAHKPRWDGTIHSCEVTDSRGESWNINYSQELAKKLLEMHDTGRVELRWCTTWCEDADVLEKALGWPRLYRSLYTAGLADMSYSDMTLLKLQAAFEVVEVERRPLIWVDDTAIPTTGSHHVRLCREGPALLLKPETQFGMTRDDILRIMEFTERLTA